MERHDVLIGHEVGRELDECRSFIIMRYFKGNIARKKLVKVLGVKIAKDIDFIMEKTKDNLNDARKLAKKRW